MSRLLTIAEAAEQLGVPKGSLETAARTTRLSGEHGQSTTHRP